MRVIHVLRKPLSEGTVAANTLRHGTGGLNIDACRIGTADDVPSVHATRKSDYPQSYKGDGAGWGRTRGGHAGDEVHWEPKGGRWPANVILQHLDGCRCEGTKRVKGSSCRSDHIGKGREGDHTNGIYGAKASKITTAYVGSDGKESVADWICEPGCPVARLDEQSGVLKSGALPSTQYTEGDRDNSSMFAGGGVFTHQGYKADTGGASRFYKQIGGSDE